MCSVLCGNTITTGKCGYTASIIFYIMLWKFQLFERATIFKEEAIHYILWSYELTGFQSLPKVKSIIILVIAER